MKKNILLLPVLLILAAASPKLPKRLKKSFSHVPSGMAVVGKDTLFLQAYYMSNYEISNIEYKEYLDFLDKQGDKEAIQNARIRNENWTKLNQNLMAVNYHTNPDFAQYPVVNVTYLGAVGYCNYMTTKMNEILKKSGIKVKVRLPFHAEIVRAGVGDNHQLKYPWLHSGVQNEKGQMACNHRTAVETFSTQEKSSAKTDDSGKNSSAILAPVISYWPSQFGVFNLSGNAAEMINLPGIAVGGSWLDKSTDVSLQSIFKYEETAANVGFRIVVTWLED